MVERAVETGELRIRPATVADLADIAELLLATRADAVPAMPPLARPAEEVRAFVLGWDLDDDAGREVWLAEDDLGAAGFAVLRSDWLDSLYVGPDRQGSGVGSALLELVKSVRPDGFGLWVFASNAPARAFYHRHGLIELELTDGSANQEGAPDVHMAWPGNHPQAYLRARIDAIDDELAELLARRFALAAAVQGYKPRGGHVDRDPVREHEIAERMARHVPGLEVERVARVLDAIIAEGIDRWEASHTGFPGDDA